MYNLSGMKRIRRKSFIIASLLQFSKHWGQNFDITQNLQNVDTKIYKAQLYWIKYTRSKGILRRKRDT